MIQQVNLSRFIGHLGKLLAAQGGILGIVEKKSQPPDWRLASCYFALIFILASDLYHGQESAQWRIAQ
jgi:hypothetical protein